MEEVKKKKVLILQADTGGCGQYRILQPLNAILEAVGGFDKHTKYEFEISFTLQFKHLQESDIVYMQRQTSPTIYQMMLSAKQFRPDLKYIYEIDDLLFMNQVSQNSPAASIYNKPETIASIRRFLLLSDAVVTSTDYLTKQIKDLKLNENVFTCENNVTPEMMDVLEPYKTTRPSDEFRILWAGSSTHKDDLMEVYPAIKEFLRDHPKAKFISFGMTIPEFEELEMSQFEYYNFTPYELFIRLMKSFNPTIAIAPIKDNPFNKAKSDIKYLEYSYLGFPTLASNVGPYGLSIKHNETGYLASKFSDWKKILNKAYADWEQGSEDLNKVSKAAHDYVTNFRTYQKNWAKWENVLDFVLEVPAITPTEKSKTITVKN